MLTAPSRFLIDVDILTTLKNYKGLQNADLEKMALAAEADAGQALPGLRESLAEARAGVFAEVHTPAQIATRKAIAELEAGKGKR